MLLIIVLEQVLVTLRNTVHLEQSLRIPLGETPCGNPQSSLQSGACNSRLGEGEGAWTHVTHLGEACEQSRSQMRFADMVPKCFLDQIPQSWFCQTIKYRKGVESPIILAPRDNPCHYLSFLSKFLICCLASVLVCEGCQNRVLLRLR